MKFEIDLWYVVVLASMLIGAFWALAKMMLEASQRAVEDKFVAVSAGLKSQDETNRRLERDLMELKAELPRDYVRREDYTAAIATIMTKIDSVALRMEQAIQTAYMQATKRTFDRNDGSHS